MFDEGLGFGINGETVALCTGGLGFGTDGEVVALEDGGFVFAFGGVAGTVVAVELLPPPVLGFFLFLLISGVSALFVSPQFSGCFGWGPDAVGLDRVKEMGAFRFGVAMM